MPGRVAASRQRERNFASLAMGQLALGAIALLVLPRVAPDYRSPVLFYRISTVNGSRTADGAMATTSPERFAQCFGRQAGGHGGTAAALAAY